MPRRDNFKVPSSRGFQSQNVQSQAAGNSNGQTGIKDVVLHTLLARVAGNNGNTEEALTKFDANACLLDIELDQTLLDDLTDNVEIGPKLEQYLNWLTGGSSGGGSGPGGGVTDHGDLDGLLDDDHTQYLLVTGGRALSGDLSMGGNTLTNLAAPSAGSDAATKDYVDSAVVGSHNHDASDIASGTFDDARIAESNVTQHEGAIDHNNLLNYDVAEHRTINDSGSASTDLWSANKIATEIAAAAGDGTLLVSPNDTTPATLSEKLVTGSKSTLDFTETNDGGDETYEVEVNEPNLDIYPLVVSGNTLISGGASWVSGLKFSITALNFIIQDTFYTTTAAEAILEDADPTLDRIDAIVVSDGADAATITASTIAFNDNNPADDTITDSGNGFVAAGFVAGQVVEVSGSSSNDGFYTINTVAAGTLTLNSDGSGVLSAEAAGSSITITSTDHSVITGTAAANPAQPDIDEPNQLAITFVNVSAGASEPDITTTDIYDENAGNPTEWAASTNSGNFDVASTNDAYSGTTSIEATGADQNNRVDLDAPGDTDIADLNLLQFAIKSKGDWGNAFIRFRFRVNNANNGVWVNFRDGDFGFDSTNTSDWQVFAIDKALFRVNSQTVDELRIQVRNNNNIGFYIDQIRLQEGVPTSAPQPVFTNIVSDDGETNADSATDTLSILGGDGFATSISSDVLTIDQDIANAPTTTLSGSDLLMVADVDDSNATKQVTAQDIADLAAGGSSGLNQYGDGTFTETANGSNAGGFAGTGSDIGGAGGLGSLTTGYADAGSDIVSTGLGAWAGGFAGQGAGFDIQSNGSGSLAFGHVAANYDINASANGSIALGSASTGNIYATASSALQLGPGTNDTAISLRVGDSVGIHIHGAGAPGAPANGDFWVASNNVYVRSGGGTYNLSDIGSGSGGLSQNGSGTFTASGNGANIGGDAGAGSTMLANAAGTFIHGAASNNADIRAGGIGAWAGGNATYGANYDITASGGGALAHGWNAGGNINATNYGSFAHGVVTGTGSGIISAGGYGAVAMGHASDSSISATLNGSVALGSSGQGGVYATGIGAIAVGSGAQYAITASADGSGAFGRAYDAAITASAYNAFQFGDGTNDTALSLRVGNTTGIHLHGGGAPGVPANGDFWVASNNVYVRSGGGTYNLSDIGSGGGGGLNQYGVGTFTESGNGANVGGNADAGASIVGSGAGALAHGYATNTRSITGSATGTIAFGCAAGGNIAATQQGAMAFAHTIGGTQARTTAGAQGSLAFGKNNDNGGSFAEIRTYGAGALAHGYVLSNTSNVARLTAAAGSDGAHVHGHINGNGYIDTSTGGAGGFVGGYATGGGTLQITADGSIAHGHTLGGTITATAVGALAHGAADATYGITASGSGSGAFGYATTANIVASAASAFQFGEGTNDTATSLRVGNASGIHIHGAGAPGAPANGDFWVASGNIYARSGGGTYNLSDIGSGGGGGLNQAGSGSFTETGSGANAGGYTQSATDSIVASQRGAFAHGAADNTGSDITSSGAGSWAGGNSDQAASITAAGSGSLAFGDADGSGSNITTNSTGRGALAFGRVSSGGDILAYQSGAMAFGVVSGLGRIRANSQGSIVMGRVSGTSNIYGNGYGTLSVGNAESSGNINASADGAVALGDASTGAITASATSALQLGPGTNDTTTSLRVGDSVGIHIHGAGAPGAPANGDFWVASGNIYAQSGGGTYNLSDIGSGGGGGGLNQGTASSGTITDDSESNAGGYATGAGSTIVSSTGLGAFAHGHASGGADVIASGNGATAFGRAAANTITASGVGSFAAGYSNSSGTITAAQPGSIAMGRAYIGTIYANAVGAIAVGYTGNGNINATGVGSLAVGRTYGSYVTASGLGSFAIGNATAAIVASATNSFMFGLGTNDTADSLRVGGSAGLHFHGGGAPGAPADGDFWVASNNVYVRTGGSTVDLGAGGGGGGLNQDGGATFTTTASKGQNIGGYATTSGTIACNSSTYGAFVHGRSTGASSYLGVKGYGSGNLVTGNAQSAGQIYAYGSGGLVFGHANGTSSIIRTDSSNYGAMVGGYTNGGGYIRSGGHGSFATGRARRSSTNQGRIRALGDGSFAIGSVYGSGGNANIEINSNAEGGMAHGFIEDQGTIDVDEDGGFAGGFIDNNGTIRASGKGAIAHGSVDGTSGGNLYANQGGIAVGYMSAASTSGTIAAGSGSISVGAVTGGSYRVSSAFGTGNGAFGRATNADVYATGSYNCFQFGQGSNSVSHSLQVGGYGSEGLRFIATGTPGTPANGDFWHQGDDVLVRTGGSSLNLSNVPASAGLNKAGNSSYTQDAAKGQNVGGYHSTSGTLTIASGNYGGTVIGRATGASSVIQVYGYGSGGLAHGYASSGARIRTYGSGFASGRVTGASTQLHATGYGSWAGGYVSGGGQINSTAQGSFAFGNATRSSTNQGRILAQAQGSFAFGRVNGSAGNANIEINSAAEGGMAHGFIEDRGIIDVDQDGGFAGGFIDNNGTIRASGKGAIAHGSVDGTSGGNIYASEGGIAIGHLTSASTSGTISASNGGIAVGSVSSSSGAVRGGTGSIAVGAVTGGSYYVSANYGTGNGAFGRANDASVSASGGYNCFQFGQGTNSLSHSLQVGGYGTEGLRFIMTGTPGSPANGDFWHQGTDIYVRTGGVSLNLSNVPANAGLNKLNTATLTEDAAKGQNVGGRSDSSGTLQVATGNYGGLVSGRSTGASSVLEVYGYGSGGFATGYVSSGARIRAGSPGFAWGRATGASTYIHSTGYGSQAGGYASGGGQIQATAQGSFAFGSATRSSTNEGRIRALATGSFAFGRVNGSAGNANIEINSNAEGGMAHGFIEDRGIIDVDQDGGFAGGFIDNNGTIRATGRGAIAHGSVDGTSGGTIYAGQGGIAVGDVTSGSTSGAVRAGSGSIAVGQVSSGSYYVSCNYGSGNGAFGRASAASVTAQGSYNCFQFGQGSNSTSDSLQIGGNGSEGLRFIMTGTPGSPADGDFWHQGTDIYVRTGGVSLNLSNVPANAGLNKVGNGTLTENTTRGQNVGGRAYNSGTLSINANMYGGLVVGHATGASSVISAKGYGQSATALGYASSGGHIYTYGSGAIASGISTGSSSLIQAGYAALAIGYASGGGQVYANGRGSLAMGHTSSSGVIEVDSTSDYGAFAMGRANNGDIISGGVASFAMGQTDNATARLQATGNCSFAFGFASGAGTTIEATAVGSSARGYATGDAYIRASGAGGSAGGRVAGGSSSTRLAASGTGAFSHAFVTSAGTGTAYVDANGSGSGAMGYARANTTRQANMLASGSGVFVFGHAYGNAGNATLSAGGSGCIAFGFAEDNTIYAGGAGVESAMQLGPGSNAQNISFQVGDTTDGVRINGSGAAPTSNKHNGDIWVDGTDMYVRSGDVDRALTFVQFHVIENNTATSGTPNALTDDESGKVFENEGASAENHHTLPATPSDGCNFTFVVKDTDGIQVNAPNGSTTIRSGANVSAGGGDIASTTVGSVVKLVALSTTEWYAMYELGTWTVT